MIKKRVGIIINNPSFDGVSYALTIASMSAANLKEVHVLFTYGAIRRLLKGKTDVIEEETNTWIRKDLEQGLKSGHIKKISEMIFYLKGFGGKIYTCTSAMAFHNIANNDLIEEVDETIGILTFLEKTEGATMLYV